VPPGSQGREGPERGSGCSVFPLLNPLRLPTLPHVPEEGPEAQQQLARALEARDGSAFLKSAESVHYADLAAAYEDLASDEERAFFVQTLGPEDFSDVLPELPERLVEGALAFLKPSQLREVLEELSDDDRVDVLQDLDEVKRQELIGLLDYKEEELTRTLLKYDEDTAGGRMTTQIGRVSTEMTVKEALEHLRPALEDTESLTRIFVLDEKERLVGKLRLRDLTFNSWQTPLRDIMKPVEQTVLATTDQEEAAVTALRYDMVVLPVVDEAGRLLGVITSDDAMEILSEESTEDIEKGAGLTGHQSEESYLNTRVFTHFRRRFLWLFVLALLAIASGYVMLRFEHVLDTVFLLALFLPMVIAAGGNTGGQASTMVIRAMALNELAPADTLRVAWKELRLGVLLGLILSVCIGLVAVFVMPAFRPEMPAGITYPAFGLAVAAALGVQVAASTLIGALLPLGASSIKLDPAVIAAPAVTTVVDVTGMVIYFTIARALLGL